MNSDVYGIWLIFLGGWIILQSPLVAYLQFETGIRARDMTILHSDIKGVCTN